MAAILHIHGSGKGRAELDRRAIGADVIEVGPELNTLVQVARDSGADAAVIDPGVEWPLRIARTVHDAAPQAHIVFMTTAQSEPVLRRELMLAPRIGRYWSLARTDAPRAVSDAIRNALQSTNQRRSLRTTIGRVNSQLASRAQTPRPVVSDHFLATVLYQLSDGVITVDAAGTVITLNDAARRTFGPKLIRGARLSDALPAGGEELVTRLGVAEEDVTSELTLDRDGERVTVEARITKVNSDRGERVGTAILARDITERRAGEERQRLLATVSVELSSTIDLDRAMQRLARFLSNTFRATAVVDIIDGEAIKRRGVAVPSGSLEAEEILRGFAPQGDKHPGIQAFRSAKKVVLENVGDDYLRDVARTDEHFAILRELQTRSIAVVPIAAGPELIGAVSLGRGSRFTATDVRLLEAIAEIAAGSIQNMWLYHAAEHGNRMKDEFLATLSHELRTPMTSVLGWIQLLESGALDESTTAEAFASMHHSARAQAQLIDDLLDLSRIQMGKLHLQMQLVDVGAIVRAAADTVRPAATARAIALEIDLSGELKIEGDANRLQQVVWNLLSNSVKFSERGGFIRVTAAADQDQVRIEVADSGKGIDPEFLPFVFDRFRQAESSATRRYGGLGLGLAIVRQIVELHGGTVEAFSDGIGRGATFVVRLPLK